MKIAFLCVANSARSQLAEGLGRRVFAGLAEVVSAGSRPSQVNPMAIQALQEVDIDISGHRSKSTDEIDFRSVDLIITLCAEEVCPIVPGATKKLHWPHMDPAGPVSSGEQQLQNFRDVRDAIQLKLEKLRSELFPK